MPKKGEKITDPEQLEKLKLMREKAALVRKQKAEAKQDVKLAEKLEEKQNIEQASSMIPLLVSNLAIVLNRTPI